MSTCLRKPAVPFTADIISLRSAPVGRIVDRVLEDALYTVERRRDQLEFLDHLFCVPALPQSQAFNGSQEGRRDVGGDASNGGLGILACGPVGPLSGALRMQCFDSRPFPGHPRRVHRHPVLQFFGPPGRFLLVLFELSAALL